MFMRNIGRWVAAGVFIALFFIRLIGFSGLTPALAGQDEDFNPSRAIDNINKIRHEISSGSLDIKRLDDAANNVAAINKNAGQCVDTAQSELDRITQAIEALGPKAPGESGRVAEQRRTLNRRKASADSRAAECRLVILRASELAPNIEAEKRKLLTERLLHRRPDIKTLLDQGLNAFDQSSLPSIGIGIETSGLGRLTQKDVMVLGALCAIGFILGLWLRRAMMSHIGRCAEKGVCKDIVKHLVTCARYMPAIAPLAIFSVSLGLLIEDFSASSYLMTACYLLGSYLCLRVITRMALAPPRPASPIIHTPDGLGSSVSRRTNLLLILSFPFALALLGPKINGVSKDIYELIDRGMFLLIAFGFLWSIWPFLKIQGLGKRGKWLRNLVTMIVFALFAIDLMGYRNLSIFILRGVAGTLVLSGIFWTIIRRIRDIFTGLSGGRLQWQRFIRKELGIGEGKAFPGLIWLRLMTESTLWLVLGLLLLLAWGITGYGYSMVLVFLSDGFHVGKMKIVPFRILAGGFTFFFIWMTAYFIKARIEKKWLESAQGASDAGDTVSVIINYCGITLAAVVAFSVAGVDMSNLALIAGALSVGIGFGLQNIVNNFVSGLILLFERPVKKGNWIVVGGTEGYVKRIGVRSTVVQTFDDADVIVPNSELISNQVTNWMLDERSGRVRINIGVGYGSDMDLVKRLLIKAAGAHPEIKKDRKSPIKVWFMEFADSSLNFQLNFYIKNISERFSVRSDIMLKIDRLFRENGIEMPFPQRDVHIKDWPQGDTKASSEGSPPPLSP